MIQMAFFASHTSLCEVARMRGCSLEDLFDEVKRTGEVPQLPWLKRLSHALASELRP